MLPIHTGEGQEKTHGGVKIDWFGGKLLRGLGELG